MKTKILTLFFLLAVTVSAIGLFVGCGGRNDNTENNMQELAAVAADVHVKEGETADFSGLAEGIEVDVSSVDWQKAGKYVIVYSLGDSKIEKTAFVYGMPVFNRNGEELPETLALTYKEANAADFLSAASFGISAQDTFGNALSVTARPEKLYIGDYGDYNVVYTASDNAGNTATATVKYTVAGNNAPVVAPLQFDVIDTAFDVAVSLGDTEVSGIWFNGKPVDPASYTASENKITVQTDILDALEIEELGDYTVRIITDEWYAETTASLVDAKPAVFGEMSCNNYIFEEGAEIRLPVPKKENKQDYTLRFEVAGCDTELSADGDFVTVTGAGIGTHKLVATAYRGAAADTSKEAVFTVYGEKEYAEKIAPLTSDQFDGELTVLFAHDGTVEFDAQKQAYKRTITNKTLSAAGTELNAAITVKPESTFLTKYNANYANYDYVAVDIMFDGTIGTDFNSVIFYIGSSIKSLSDCRVYAADDLDRSSLLDASGLTAQTWYTVLVETGPLFEEYLNNKIFVSQSPGQSPYTDLWVRNVRFENELNLVRDGYIYEQSEEEMSFPTFGNPDAQYEMEGPDGAELIGGNSIKMSVPGSYTVTVDGKQTVSFDIYETDEYARVLANNLMQFGTVTSSKFTASDALIQKYQASYEQYNYLAVDVKFTADKGIMSVRIKMGDLLAQGIWYGEVEVYLATDTAKANRIVHDNLKADTLYTVYFLTGELALENNEFFYCGDGFSAVWSNIRFEGPKQETTYEEIKNGYYYVAGQTVMQLPAAETEWTLSQCPSGAALTDGNKITLEHAGYYVAETQGQSIVFTVCTQEEFDRILAPLNGSGQFKDEELIFDTSNGTIIKTDESSDFYKKYNAGLADYDFMALDFKFAKDNTNPFTVFYLSDTAGSSGYQNLADLAVYLASDTERKEQITDPYTNMQNEVWYTVLIPAKKFSYNFGTVWILLECHGQMDIQNIRFVEAN